ncbi:hypothetical protein DC347_16330 [Pseudarthrobacter sp. AG30]|uniref:hypothetical protein n=1 Tax=Pseudarthrobacter sp. AG30 TaxID=2249742 RepID=UPI000D6EAECE|nr:hypothetical protein [Pseudarthrobacter sp. AG30]RAX15505.1 hypothetical protein DC347_16330 [Pseudarthrobacter sp. AG30]
MGKRWIFDGHIAGIGTASGLRAVVGIWQDSPFGSFADVMVQQPSGHRLLLAPRPDVAEFIAATYTFDEVRLVDVSAMLGERALRVDAGPLAIRAVTGARTFLGTALRAVPRRLAVHPRWLSAVSPLAALAAPGARTYGTAGSGRAEYYGVSDLHHVTSAVVRWEGADAGTLAPIRPAVTFGFSSVPPRPSVARVRTTVVQS